MKKFQYTLSVSPKQVKNFKILLAEINKSIGSDLENVELVTEFDGPDGHYCFILKGTELTYKIFLSIAALPDALVKSICYIQD